jgi:hypothetical protein
MNQFESIFQGKAAKEFAATLQSMSPEEKENLSWAEKAFLTAEERSAFVKNTIVEFNGRKFKCAPFTLGLYVDMAEVMGIPSNEEKLKASMNMMLVGVTPSDKLYLTGEMYTDIRNVGEEPVKFSEAMNVRGAVDFFSVNCMRTGAALATSAPDLADKIQGKKKKK